MKPAITTTESASYTLNVHLHSYWAKRYFGIHDSYAEYEEAFYEEARRLAADYDGYDARAGAVSDLIQQYDADEVPDALRAVPPMPYAVEEYTGSPHGNNFEFFETMEAADADADSKMVEVGMERLFIDEGNHTGETRRLTIEPRIKLRCDNIALTYESTDPVEASDIPAMLSAAGYEDEDLPDWAISPDFHDEAATAINKSIALLTQP